MTQTSTRPPTPIGFDRAGSLCSSGHRASIMDGVFVRILQEHFSRRGRLILNGRDGDGPQLDGVLWTPDAETTKIQISGMHDYNRQDVQRRPALYVERQDWESERYAIGNRVVGGCVVKTDDGRFKQLLGEKYTVKSTGSHLFWCIGAGDNGQQAQLLGDEVYDFFMSFMPLLFVELQLHSMFPPKMGKLQVIPEHRETRGVPVSLGYEFYPTWRLTMIAPFLRSIGIIIEPQVG